MIFQKLWYYVTRVNQTYFIYSITLTRCNKEVEKMSITEREKEILELNKLDELCNCS